MDERQLQLKQMKKTYKKLRAKAGRSWRVLSWLMFLIWLPICVITLFVLLNHVPIVQMIDNGIWEPVKAALQLEIDYVQGWRLAEQYGLMGSVFCGVLWILFAILARVERSAVQKSDEYLSYRTLKLTLETEREEK